MRGTVAVILGDSKPQPPSPTTLILVRHGQSVGNVAADRARDAGALELDLDVRDADVPLTAEGVEQARALGAYLSASGPAPAAVLSSPYRRAVQTASEALASGGFDLPIELDERLREREFGVLDRLTRKGIEARFPEESARRNYLGRYYHRPPGGESWVDVGQRVRGTLDRLASRPLDGPVLIVAHEVVIHMIRAVAEGLNEAEILTIADREQLGNCSVGIATLKGEWRAS